MASNTMLNLTADELEFIRDLRKKKASSSVPTTVSESTEHTPSPAKETVNVEDLPSPLSSPLKARDSQLVEGRLRKRGA